MILQIFDSFAFFEVREMPIPLILSLNVLGDENDPPFKISHSIFMHS